MTIKKLRRKIKFKKNLLNKLLLFINPTNSFIVSLSKSLDNDVSLYQKKIYRFYKSKKGNSVTASSRLIA